MSRLGTNLNFLTVGGNVYGPITLNSNSTGGARIGLQSYNGSLLGNVDLESYFGEEDFAGGVNLLAFVNGTIGTPSTPVTIRADGFVDSLFAAAAYVTIRGTPSLNGGVLEQLGRIDIAAVEGIGDGTLHADIYADEIPSLAFPLYVQCNGPFKGLLMLNSMPAGNGNYISVPFNGLRGYIVVNLFGGQKEAALIEDAPVIVGGIEFSQDDRNSYNNTAASLGGGAYGSTGFNLHRADCAPIYQQTITDRSAAPSPSSPILIRHYGPVNWLDSHGVPYKIERRKIGAAFTDPWSDESNCFTQQRGSVVSGVENPSVVVLTPGVTLQAGFDYRVTHKTYVDFAEQTARVLRCDLPVYEPPLPELEPLDVASQTADYTYSFSVCNTAALGDADDNGCVNFADVIRVLAMFGSTACLKTGDADRDGIVDFADVISVLANMNNTYCGACSQSFAPFSGRRGPAQTQGLEDDGDVSAASVTLSQALASLGYSSIEQFVSAISAMSQEDRNAAVQQLGALLE